MRRTVLRAVLGTSALAAALIPAAPAGAITGGSPDTVHTNVGLVRFTTADGRFRCSGTLVSERVVLTAGHCTEGPAKDVYVSFDDKLQPDPLQPGISDDIKAERLTHYIHGVAHPDPNWYGKLSFSQQHDQGVVVLDEPASSKWENVTPAPLPPVGLLDQNQGALKNEIFTLVGYGVKIGEKKATVVNGERRSTTSPLKAVQDEVVTFQINDNDSKGGGGSCFGDSGGGVFWRDEAHGLEYVLGDASYVNSLKCNATGSYQRVDTRYSQDFVKSFIEQYG